MNITFMEYYTHATSFLIYRGFSCLMSVDVENGNFLKYGRIGKHPLQSLYI